MKVKNTSRDRELKSRPFRGHHETLFCKNIHQREGFVLKRSVKHIVDTSTWSQPDSGKVVKKMKITIHL